MKFPIDTLIAATVLAGTGVQVQAAVTLKDSPRGNAGEQH
jgi:hypothetical protein